MKYLIAGLGNIGEQYLNTRHNIGFKIIEALALEAGASFISERLASHATYKWKGKNIHLIKPSTFMNESGKAIHYWLRYLDIPTQRLLVVMDDLSLPFGQLRIKSAGSDGGHNGLKSIQQYLSTTEYPRLRFGIGNNFRKGLQVKYVLGEWNEEEKKLLPEKLSQSVDAIKNILSAGLQRTMNDFNKKKTEES